MGFFDFLQPVEHDIAGAGKATLGFLDRNVVKPIVKADITSGKNIANSPAVQGFRFLGDKLIQGVANLAGNQEVASNAQTASEGSATRSKASLQSGLDELAYNIKHNPGSLVGPDSLEVSTPLDIEGLAKASSVDEVKKTLGDSVGPQTAEKIAPSIAATSDPNVIHNIINGSTSIPAEPPTAHIPAPKDVQTAIEQEVQGRLANPAPATIQPQDTSVAPNPLPQISKVADTAYQDTVKNGGVTINLDNNQPSKGIAFSPYKDTEFVVDKSSFTPEAVDNYVKTHADKLNIPGNHLGIWEENGNIYMDISQVGEKSAATLQKAIDAKQLAAFDLENFKEIPLGKIDKGVYNQLHEASSHPYLNEGQNTPANPPGAGGEPGTVPSQDPQGFVETVGKSANTTPDLKEGVNKIVQQGTEGKSNQLLTDNAKKLVAENYDKALEQVRTTKNLTDEDVAVGQELVKRAQSEGRINDAVDLVERLDQKLRESGRAVQAASLWDKLSPEGILKIAERKISQAREGFKNAPKEGETASDIQKAVEGSAKIGKKDVSKIVDDIANGKPKEEQTTGQKVAKKVENQVTPKVKAKADLLVNELSKKVKEELLPENAKATPKSAIDVLKEVFSRNQEAHEAFPEAQRILKEKFADNPKALATLDKFFTTELKLPAADTTINNAIREQLKTNGESVTNIISKSLAAQKTSVEDISQSLVKEGFDKVSADTLAKEVRDRLVQQVTDAKTSVLERLAQEAKPKAKPTYLDKLTKLSNLGALGNEDYLHIARAKLGLPQLTTEIATKLTDLAQKVQDLPVDSPERYETIRQIGEQIRKAAPPRPPSLMKQLLGAPKSTLASFDLSGGGRQGAVLGTRFPQEFANSFKSQVKFFASEDAFNKGMAEIAADPRAGLMEKSGLALTGIREFGRPEEAFASSLPEKIPLFGRGIAASDRAYTGGLTQLRADVFNNIADHLETGGIKMEDLPESHLKSIGRFINTASGRGDLGALETHAQSLGEALFSPRLWKSRLDMLNPKYYYDLKGPARIYALQSAASFAGTAAVVLGLATAAGAKVETDARSSDFLKIKVGNTRFDILGGFQQNLVLAERELKGEKKNSQSGAITKLGSGFGAADRLSILSDFITNKENPIIATAGRILKGKDIAGNPVNPYTEIGKLAIPLGIQDTYTAVKDSGVGGGIAKAAPGFVGIGTQTYGPTTNAAQNKIINKLKSTGASQDKVDAYTKYYQVSSIAKGTRQNVSDAINEALKASDFQKAQQLATDYNKQYAAQFKDWASQYSTQADEALTKDYNSNKINLTKAALKARLKAIKAKP